MSISEKRTHFNEKHFSCKISQIKSGLNNKIRTVCEFVYAKNHNIHSIHMSARFIEVDGRDYNYECLSFYTDKNRRVEGEERKESSEIILKIVESVKILDCIQNYRIESVERMKRGRDIYTVFVRNKLKGQKSLISEYIYNYYLKMVESGKGVAYAEKFEQDAIDLLHITLKQYKNYIAKYKKRCKK